jgi:sugar phosphate isomerase/epimerase
MNIRGIAINADAGVIDGNLTVLRKELDYYREMGFTHVEMAPHSVDAIYCGRLNKNRVKEVQMLLAQYPFRYTVHGLNPLNLMSDDVVNRQGFIASIEFAAAIDAEIMVYHAGRYLAEENFLLTSRMNLTPVEKNVLWEQECTALQSMGDIAARYGIMIAVENARPYLNAPNYCYAESLEELVRMVKAVNHNQVGITLDTGHAYLAACHYGYDLLESISSIAPYVRHIHLHDNFGRCCTSWERKQYEMVAMGRGDMHMPIGWGSIPADEIFARLPQYDGCITLELRPRYRECYGVALSNAQALVKLYTDNV